MAAGGLVGASSLLTIGHGLFGRGLPASSSIGNIVFGAFGAIIGATLMGFGQDLFVGERTGGNGRHQPMSPGDGNGGY